MLRARYGVNIVHGIEHHDQARWGESPFFRTAGGKHPVCFSSHVTFNLFVFHRVFQVFALVVLYVITLHVAAGTTGYSKSTHSTLLGIGFCTVGTLCKHALHRRAHPLHKVMDTVSRCVLEISIYVICF